MLREFISYLRVGHSLRPAAEQRAEPLGEPAAREVEFALVHLHAERMELLPPLITSASGAAAAHSAVRESLSNSIIVYCIGLVGAAPQPGSAGALAAAIIKDTGGAASVVYGNRTCMVGVFGDDESMHFGALIPGFDELLGTVMALEAGASVAV